MIYFMFSKNINDSKIPKGMKLVEQSVHSSSSSRTKPTLHSHLNPTATGTQIEFGNAEHALGELKKRSSSI